MVRGSGTKWDYELQEIIERVQLGEVAESSGSSVQLRYTVWRTIRITLYNKEIVTCTQEQWL